MKKTYLVKKDPAKEGPENWIIMNGYEFAQFMKTPEGISRRKNFGQLDSCGSGDEILVVECGAPTAKKLRSEKDSHDYLKECEIDSGYKTFSYSSVCTDDEGASGEEMLPDKNCDVESSVINRVFQKDMREAVKNLDGLHRTIINCYFFEKPLMTEKELSKKLGMSQQLLHYHKKVALKILKRLLEN